ncbi:MAG: porin family protein [Ferruginibacter sp.]|uniref:outer membrane beta-barrel protein n=1 Tax=Ferruginibacter sp. TaxID=1940288 RepID=UPI00265B28E1|nr:hypothetical protein [Ferruginibacter sp.]MDB5279074.1 porin family protein [Ferruginibacter sp.]
MQYLENDMDDLFKRAAENYPLKTGDGDWESIALRIKPELTTPQAAVPSKKSIGKELLTLILVLFTLPVSDALLQQPTTWELFNTPKTLLAKKDAVAVALLKEEGTNKTSRHTYNTLPAGQSLKHSGQHYLYSKKSSSKSTRPDKQNNQFSQDRKDNERHFLSLYAPEKKLYEVHEISTTNKIVRLLNDDATSLTNQKKSELDTTSKKETPGKDSDRFQKKKTFYIGVAAGPDLSKVQSAAFTNTGIGAGLFAGVNLAGNVYIETGISWNRKNYSSMGDQFSMKKIASTMPQGMVITSLEGKSSLIEIPVKIKYDFMHKANAIWFAAAGISAYIMTSEKNRYHVTMNGNTGMMAGVYKKNTYGLPAVANISLGYQKNVSKFINIRIEPFLKIPLQGMGVGELHITSAGLQVGIARLLK